MNSTACLSFQQPRRAVTVPALMSRLPGRLQLPAVPCGPLARERSSGCNPPLIETLTHVLGQAHGCPEPSHHAWVWGIAPRQPSSSITRKFTHRLQQPLLATSPGSGEFTPLGSRVTSFLPTLSLFIFLIFIFLNNVCTISLSITGELIKP